MDKSYLYNPFYSNKKSVTSYNTVSKPKNSYSNPSASTSTMKPKKSYSKPSASTSTMKPKNAKSKIKWNQIIILALILGVIGVIVYFVVDAFKKKCPDPERPVYNKTYGCIPQCNSESEIYDDNEKDCVLRELCSEDPKKPYAHPVDDPNSLCSGQQPYCMCGPECFNNEMFNPVSGTCDCLGTICPDGRCCKDGEDCIDKGDGTYLCCDEDNLVYDSDGNPKECCGAYTKPNESKTKCIPYCGPTTEVGKTSNACEDSICSVAVFF